MPFYLVSRPSTPVSLGNASHYSDDNTPPQVDQRREIDVTNSLTKRINSTKPQTDKNATTQTDKLIEIKAHITLDLQSTKDSAINT